MFLFLKLYLAHLIGDFILQFEELYRLKVRSLWGHLFHVLIHALVSLLLVFPFLTNPRLTLFVLAVSTVHYFQDIVKYTLQQKMPHWRFVLFVSDQIVHLLVVASVLLFPWNTAIPETPSGAAAFYYNNEWTLYAIAFVLSTFGGGYLLHSFRTNYMSGTRPDHFISRFEMSHGLAERTLVTAFFMLGTWPWMLAAAAAAAAMRLPFPLLRNRTDFLMSFLYAAAVGLAFRSRV